MSDLEKPKRGETSDESENPPARLVGALVLIALGVLFFLSEFDVLDLSGNWWAIFILAPGLYLLWRAYQTYSETGALAGQVASQAGGGAVLLVIGLIFLFDLDWGRFWPLILIVVGVAALLGAGRGRE